MDFSSSTMLSHRKKVSLTNIFRHTLSLQNNSLQNNMLHSVCLCRMADYINENILIAIF